MAPGFLTRCIFGVCLRSSKRYIAGSIPLSRFFPVAIASFWML